MDEEAQPSTLGDTPVTVDAFSSSGSQEAHIIMVKGEENAISNGELHQEEEASLDGEFIKVEKEPLDSKEEGCLSHDGISEHEDLNAGECSLGDSVATHLFVEYKEKVKALEIELESISKKLQFSESEKLQLMNEVDLAKGRLDERDKYCCELELNEKVLQEKISETQLKCVSQLAALQEALEAQDVKQNELIRDKEEYVELSAQLEDSKRKMLDLGEELQSSLGRARKFEELHKQSDAFADSETQKALELQRMLEVTKESAQEMESQMWNLQEEIKGLYEKITEKQEVEIALNKTLVQLTDIQSEVECFKLQVTDLERMLASERANTCELMEEVNLHKTSKDQMKNDVDKLENQLLLLKEDLHAKILNLEATAAKLDEETKLRMSIELNINGHEEMVASIHGELAKAIAEKEVLKKEMDSACQNLEEVKELCVDLESKTKLSEQNFSKADGLLSEALLRNEELEQKLKSIEILQKESALVAATTSQRNAELEEIVHISNAGEAEAKSCLEEIERQLLSLQQKNMELEEQIHTAHLKNNEAESQLNESCEKINNLTAELESIQSENSQLKRQLLDYEEKTTQLESVLLLSSEKHYGLEQELKSLASECSDHKSHAHTSHQRALELEDVIQISNSKFEKAERKLAEMEFASEMSRNRIQELEEQALILEAQCGKFEAESTNHLDKLFEREADMKFLHNKVSNLETLVTDSAEKEKELMRNLAALLEEKTKLDDATSRSQERLFEVETLLGDARDELKVTEDRLQSVLKELETSKTREAELVEKLKYAESQTEQQERMIEQANSRNQELESVHHSLAKGLEQKLQEAMASLSEKDTEMKCLFNHVKSLEEHVELYKQQIEVAAKEERLLRADLEEKSMKLLMLEAAADELTGKAMEADKKCQQSFEESELLSSTNLELRNQLLSCQSKVSELQELLGAFGAEKEDMAKKLVVELQAVSELKNQCSLSLEAQSSAETRVKEAELRIEEIIDRVTQKDLEINELSEKLNAAELQLNLFKLQSEKATEVGENLKVEHAEACRKLQLSERIVDELQSKIEQFYREKESLVGSNLDLTQSIVVSKTRINELEIDLHKLFSEKEETVKQLHISQKLIEELREQLTVEKQKLKLQVSSLSEENCLLTKRSEDAKEEYREAMSLLEADLNEQKTNEETLRAEVERLKAEITEKSFMQIRVSELEQQLVLTEAKTVDEVTNMQKVAAEKEAGLRHKLEEQTRGLAEKDLLVQQVARLQEELNLAQSTITRKNNESAFEDSGSSHSELKKAEERKSKQVSRAAPGASSQTVEVHSTTMSFKFVMGVALVSVVVGVILGKRY